MIAGEMPPMIVRILFFVVLAIALVILAFSGSSDRRVEQERRINAERVAATQPTPASTSPSTLPSTRAAMP